MKTVAATPVAFVHAIGRAYAKYGRDPGPALQRAQIPPELLHRPDGRITAAQMETISGLAMQELDDEALGWFSRRLPWGSYGMLCRASLSSPNLGVALKRWCRHHRLLSEDVEHTLTVNHGIAELCLVEASDLGPMREFCLITSLRFVFGYACWLVDSHIPLIETAFPFNAPPHSDVYPLLFSPGPVHFGPLDRLPFRCELPSIDVTARRAVTALDAAACATPYSFEIPPRSTACTTGPQATAPWSCIRHIARRLLASLCAYAASAAARRGNVLASPQRRSTTRAPAEPHHASGQVDRACGRLQQRKEFFAGVPSMDRTLTKHIPSRRTSTVGIDLKAETICLIGRHTLDDLAVLMQIEIERLAPSSSLALYHNRSRRRLQPTTSLA
jgi:hypothetical protein